MEPRTAAGSTTARSGEHRTHWKLGAVVFVPCTMAVVALGIADRPGGGRRLFPGLGGRLQGLRRRGDRGGCVVLPVLPRGAADVKPVLPAAVKTGTLTGSCAPAKQKVPLTGEISLLVRPGSDKPLKDGNLVVNSVGPTGGGGAVTGVEAGRDASTLTAAGVTRPKDTFSVRARSAVTHDLRSTAYSASGGTLTPDELEIEISRSGKQCC
ncbi:DUF6230 family protein [Streptomyces brasiliensis]|uniref:Uncharacterized protein n=1 Tax=Streptomyces brasiliensis TaxID=1954 RepID=A0A917L284_9ACTN|nr:DUF6230 family protein [Streptomyces brasiliensis]GGJ38728.1 hypothetical protein GCM10010121_057280 [Streptomyces brasiliensis]